MTRAFTSFGCLAIGFVSGCSSPDDAPTSAPGDPLTYELTTYLPGLAQNARIVKDLRNSRAYLDDGRVVAQTEMWRLEAEARRARFGALHPAFAEGLRAAPSDRSTRAAFFFETDALLPEIQRGLQSEIEVERVQSQAVLTAAIEKGLAAAKPALHASGVVIEHAYPSIPLILGHAVPGDIERAANLPMITVVLGAEGSNFVRTAAMNGVSDAHIDTTFNASGFWGAGQKIAHVEDTLAGLYDSHEAFSQAEQDFDVLGNGYRVTYQVEPPGCDFASDCPAAFGSMAVSCLALGHPGQNKQCVTIHASECMSVAAGTNGGTAYGAGKARFYYPNAGEPGYASNQCEPSNLLSAYDWLVAQGVTTVNESFNCQTLGWASGADLEGVVEDWYARHYNVAISKSAGNQKKTTDPADPACPYTLNSTCVGGNKLGGKGMYKYSSWTNINGWPGVRTDREEPDISMLGDNVDALETGFPYNTSWLPQSGTSFAAPAAAALAALCKEVHGGMVSERAIRVVLKSSGFMRNIRNYNYSMASTASDGPDWLDGGGGPLGEAVLAYCQGTTVGNVRVQFADDPGDLEGGDPYPFDPAACTDCDHNKPPLGGKSFPGSHAESAVPPGTGDNRKYHQLFGPVHLTARGGRIRAVIAWDSCPGTSLGTAPAPVATDIDLFLVKDGTFVVDGSQSVMDATEGFDVTIKPNAPLGEGDYSLYWAAEPGPGCDGTHFEPLAAALAWWL